MISQLKLTDYLNSMYQDTNSELDRFIKDLLIKIEFGNFEPEEEDTSNYEWEEMR